MANTSSNERIRDVDLAYHRHRQKNRVLDLLASFFTEEAKSTGVTKKTIADKLAKDPSQITRWLSSPSNITLDTISDILLSLGAEMDYRIVKFADRPKANYDNELYSVLGACRQHGREQKSERSAIPVPTISQDSATANAVVRKFEDA